MTIRTKLWTRRRCLEWLLRFGQGNVTQTAVPQRLLDEAQHFLHGAEGPFTGVQHGNTLTAEEVARLRFQVHIGLLEINQGRDWMVPLPGGSFNVRPGRLEFDSSMAGRFLFTALSLMAGPEGALVAKCARQGCLVLFMKSKHKAYCSPRCSKMAEAERARRHYASLTPAQRRARRHAAYINEVEKKPNGGAVRAAHMRKQEVKS